MTFLLLATIFFTLPLGAVPRAAAEEGLLRRVGELPFSDNVLPILSEPKSKRMLVLSAGSIDAYDPFTLDKVASMSLAPYTAGTDVPGKHVVYAWTPGQSRLYLIVYGPLPGGGADASQSIPYLAVIDPTGPRVESVRQINASPFSAGVVPQGMSYYAPQNRLYLLGQDPSALLGDYNVQLAEIDVGRAAATWTAPYALGAACQKVVANSRQAAVHRPRGSSKVYFGCGTGTLVFGREPGIPGIVGVDVSNPANLSTTGFPVSGSYASGESLYDDQANRLVLISAGAGAPAQAAWIFDEPREVVVGIISAGDGNVRATGVDPVGGRLYVGIDKSLLISTSRGQKIPQAIEEPITDILGPTINAIQFAKRVVITYLDKAGKKHIAVYETSLADYDEPPADDPDSTTIDTDESPGRTGVTFGGDAKAYGSRVHQVAGVNGVVQNLLALNTDYWALTGARAGLNDGDRNTYFGRISRARLGETEASAFGTSTDGDANTQADYKTVTGQKWPYAAAACSDLGGGKNAGTAPQASAKCDSADSHVEINVQNERSNELPSGGNPTAAALASFGGTSVASSLDRDAKAGVVVDTKAEARDVVIGGVASFGRISSHARSVAKGRSGTATSTYDRVFENVSMPGFACTTQCDPQAVVDALNARLPTSARAELPAFELTRTPRGARASALRDPWQHQQDIVLNNDGETDLEIPALRVTYFGDNAVRSRLILEFAASQANSAYSIYRLSALDDSNGSGIADLFAGSNLGDSALGGNGALTAGGQTEPLVGQLGATSGGRGQGSLGKRLAHGLRLVLTGRRALIVNALLWSLLSLPVFLAGRRRYLLELIGKQR
jgi:hypothetical protein